MQLSIRLTLLFALILPAPALRAREATNTVDAIALGYLGTGTSADGWSVTHVDNYSAGYRSALRFGYKDSCAVSPLYPNDILRVEASVLSSSAGGRRLSFLPVACKSDEGTNLVRLCDYSPSKNIFTNLTLAWPASARVRQLRLELTEVKSSTTSWGISSLRVITDASRVGLAVRLR